MREARGVVGLGLERPVSLCPGEAVEYLGPSGGWDGGASVPKSKSRQVRLTHRNLGHPKSQQKLESIAIHS